MKKYQKNYGAEELPRRFQIFQENIRRAAEYQAREKPYGARFGVTQFMDLTPEEFSSMYKMPNITTKMPYKRGPIKTEFKKSKGYEPDPKNWDWFTQGVCTPVYNQGQCGSCWAFSATETIESYNVISAGQKLVGLSMEQIVDCDTTCYGCGGGWPYLAYGYVEGAGGIDTYTSYPYTAGEGESGTCNFNKANVAAQVAGYKSLSEGETYLYQQASTTGPVSVCVDASTWQYYTGGILTSCTTSVDHCVQLTGYQNYGQDGAYWIVRNSWAASWGENGFIWIEIGQDLCLIGDYATVPDDEP
jgi:cysteine peptidase B